jgi:hypothetical protein
MNNKRFWTWLVLTLTLNVCQFALFDANEMPQLSLAFGVPFFGAVVWTPMKWFTICSDESISDGKKIVDVLIATLMGLGVSVPAGICVLFTHLCS